MESGSEPLVVGLFRGRRSNGDRFTIMLFSFPKLHASFASEFFSRKQISVVNAAPIYISGRESQISPCEIMQLALMD